MKIGRIAIILLMGIVLVAGLACGNGGGGLQPTPCPDPTPPKLGGGGALPGIYQYTRTWSSGEETIVMHVWVKGEKSRADWSLYEPPPGKNEKIKFIDDGEYKWIYEVDEHRAAKYESGAAVHQVEEHMLWFTENYYGAVSGGAIISEMRMACSLDQFCSSVAITGHETIDGQSCTQYTYSAHDGTTIIYCISDTGYLVKVESTDATGYSVTMDYTDIDLNPSISDDKFDIGKVAPGAVIVDMTAS